MREDKLIPESELILNADGSVYHLMIRPEHLAGYVILVGDPGRVKMVSGCFDTIEFKGQNREFVVHTGTYKSRRITVMSTGMGPDNMDIVLNELDALVNIDLTARQVKKEHTSLKIFRLGTSGSVQHDLPLNAVVVSAFGLGFDGMVWFYDFIEDQETLAMKQAFIAHTAWSPRLTGPYIFKASASLLKMFEKDNVYRGITVTAPGFYGPQGRKLRLPLAFPDLNEKLQTFSFNQVKVLNYEMETSALYGLSRFLGHQAVTVCLSIANRKVGTINKDYHVSMENLITWLLTRIIELKD